MPQGRGSAFRATSTAIRWSAVVFGLLYLLSSASGVRYTDPGLREQTRSVPVFHTQRRSKRDALRRSRTKAGTPLVLFRKIRRRLVQTWSVCHASASMPMPAERLPGGDAFGVDISGRRCVALGGHGRLGPGSH